MDKPVMCTGRENGIEGNYLMGNNEREGENAGLGTGEKMILILTVCRNFGANRGYLKYSMIQGTETKKRTMTLV
jgi:hypothetical protein